MLNDENVSRSGRIRRGDFIVSLELRDAVRLLALGGESA